MRVLQGFESGLVPGLESEQLGRPPQTPEVAAAVASVPRYGFLPAERRMLAGLDAEVPLARGRRAASPSALCRLMEEARLKPGARVLAVGVELGYAAALMLELGVDVTAVESDEELRVTACANLEREVRASLPGSEAARGERWDAIIYLGSVPALPREPLAMLRPDGRLIVPIRQNPVTELVLLVRGHRGHRRQDLGPIEIPRLPPALNG